MPLFNANKNSDPSQWSLLFSNILVIGVAVAQNWPPMELVLIYLIQSLIIGFFNVVRILQLKDFSVEGYFINNRPARADNYTKYFTAIFFALHYGFFHLVYAIILFAVPEFLASGGYHVNYLYLLGISILFFMNHFYSYIYNRQRDKGKENIGRLLFYPYIRILPMHMVIMFGGFFGFFGSQYLLVFFAAMKTVADMVMHRIEHKL